MFMFKTKIKLGNTSFKVSNHDDRLMQQIKMNLPCAWRTSTVLVTSPTTSELVNSSVETINSFLQLFAVLKK